MSRKVLEESRESPTTGIMPQRPHRPAGSYLACSHSVCVGSTPIVCMSTKHTGAAGHASEVPMPWSSLLAALWNYIEGLCFSCNGLANTGCRKWVGQ